MAPVTVNRALTSLKKFFNRLFKQGKITSDPAEDIKLVAIADGLGGIASDKEGVSEPRIITFKPLECLMIK